MGEMGTDVISVTFATMGEHERSADRAAPRFLTTGQSAAALGVSVNAVKAWIRAARLPALRTPGGHHRIPERDLLAFKARLAVPRRPRARGVPRVLVVDDDAELRAFLVDAIRAAFPRVAVRVAADGYQALVEVGAFRPDLLVLDLRMLLLDGFEVCRRLKARPETRSIHILAVTAYPEEDAGGRIRACGADDFLAKPFGVTEFRARVAALLGAGRRR